MWFVTEESWPRARSAYDLNRVGCFQGGAFHLFGALQGGHDQFLGSSDVIDHGLSRLFRITLLDYVKQILVRLQFKAFELVQVFRALLEQSPRLGHQLGEGT